MHTTSVHFEFSLAKSKWKPYQMSQSFTETEDPPFTFLAVLHARLQLTAHPGVVHYELLV